MFCYYLVVLLTTIHLQLATAKSVQPRQSLDQEQAIVAVLLRNETYSRQLRPTGITSPEGPVIIQVALELLSISTINEVNMEFTLQFLIHQYWLDQRLRFNNDSFKHVDSVKLARDQRIWKPDTFFRNEAKGHTHLCDQPNEFVKISNSGRVTYSKRITMTFICHMDLLLYPHDSQHCDMELASYGYTTKDIEYEWAQQSVVLRDAIYGSLPKFQIKGVVVDSLLSNTTTGAYSCLRLSLFFQRVFSYFLLQLYIPSCMLVSVSCVSFWIDWRSAPARVPLAIVTLLTMTTQAQGINAKLPPVSYSKAIDIWIGACIIFIFGALIEYAFVNYIGTNEELKRCELNRSEELNGRCQMPVIFAKAPLAYRLSRFIASVREFGSFTLGDSPDLNVSIASRNRNTKEMTRVTMSEFSYKRQSGRNFVSSRAFG